MKHKHRNNAPTTTAVGRRHTMDKKIFIKSIRLLKRSDKKIEEDAHH